MKKNIQSILKMCTLVLVASAFVFSCSDDDDNKDNAPGITGETRTYTLVGANDNNITGSATLRERTDGSTIFVIETSGTTAGQSYPVYIRSNSATETGAVIANLEPVNGTTGRSETILTEREDGNVITYDQLLALNGTLVVSMSGEAVSQADFGSNQLSGTSRTYTLGAVGDSDVSGTVTFAERMNGSTLITTNLQGTETGTTYPLYIYGGSVASPGSLAIDLVNVSGSTGTMATSMSNITETNAGTGISYDQLDTFNGHIGVVTTASPTTYVASGNIGSNDLP